MADEERLEAILELKDEFTDRLERISDKFQAFKRMLEASETTLDVTDKASDKIRKVSEHADKLRKTKANFKVNATDNASEKIEKISKKLMLLKKMKEIKLMAKDHISDKVKKILSKMKAIKNKVIALNLKDKASSAIGKLGNKLNQIVKKRWKAKIGVKDDASAVLGKIKGLLAGLAAGVVIKTTLQLGAELQQQQISMEHFMGVGNQGKSQGQIKAMTNDYIKQLRANANATPFETKDVLTAGTRALTISSGNTDQSIALVKMAEDMASSNPDKTIGDAIEALADMKMGEFERMKEFGFKGSKEAFNAAGGDFFKMKDQDGRTLSQTFGGLAAKQANTAQGKFSTIKGNISTAQQNLGTGFLQGIDPLLTKLRDKFSKLLGGEESESKFIEFGQKIGEGLLKIVDVADKVGSALKSMFDMFSEGLDLGSLKAYMEPAIDIFRSLFTEITEKSPGAQGIFKGLGVVVNFVAKMIIMAVTGTLTVIKVTFKIVGTVINTAKRIIKSLGDAWRSARSAISGAVSAIRGAVSGAMSGIRSSISRAKKVIDRLKYAWVALKEKIENNPITQVIKSVTSGGGSGGKSRKDKKKTPQRRTGPDRKAFGERRVPYNNYEARLHEGERVLTKNEANAFDRKTRSDGINITINATVREEADITKIVNQLVRQMKLTQLGGV